jgi:hypothetical protein
MSEQLKPETVPLETGEARPVDTPVDLGDKAHVTERNKKIKRDTTLRANTVTAIMSHKNGREFMFWLLSICKVNQPTFAPNALIMAHNAGEQNIGAQLLAELTTRENIDYYFQMLKEGANPDA